MRWAVEYFSVDDLKKIGLRLYKIRFVAGFGGGDQQGAFAKKLGFDVKSYSQWETGHALIQLHNAIKVRDALPGVSLDWIYCGDYDFVAPFVARALKEAPDTRPRSKRGRRPRLR